MLSWFPKKEPAIERRINQPKNSILKRKFKIFYENPGFHTYLGEFEIGMCNLTVRMSLTKNNNKLNNKENNDRVLLIHNIVKMKDSAIHNNAY